MKNDIIKLENYIENICLKANKASKILFSASTTSKNKALKLISANINKDTNKILKANKKDMHLAKNKNTSSALLDRLYLDKKRIKDIIKGLDNIIKLDDPVGKIIKNWTPKNGIKMCQTRVPIGVIGIIYESRPNVAVDASSLSLKSGNAIILRGGSESFYSSTAITNSIRNGLKESSLPINSVQMIKTTDRRAVSKLLKMNSLINLIIPRGGKSLIEKIQKDSKIPVLSHLDGLCHTYIDNKANKNMSIDIALNAKMRRTGICGATETLLCHKETSKNILPDIIDILLKNGCEIRGDKKVQTLNNRVKPADELDWHTEYLDSIISIKIVNDMHDAIHHIEKYGSNHTDAIITENKRNAEIFLKHVNSAIVIHNASTQYADGGEFGMGGEMGIATGKLHARGPVALEELTTYKYQLRGKGQIRP
tara:strand:- start:20703 stop:21974 length:1272 start_codon:yes stop_codon:yes gene_type:complete